jgi:hypothetical protein
MVKPASDIGVWAKWPDDVRPILYALNRMPDARLRFTLLRSCGWFVCADCGEECEAHWHGAAVLDNEPFSVGGDPHIQG